MTAAAFKATYSDWRLIKGRKVVQIVFELPIEAANEAYAALGGMPNPAAEVWCGVARLVQPTERKVMPTAEQRSSTVDTLPALVKPPARAPRNKLAQLAGMLSKTPLFHRYLETIVNAEMHENDAVQFVRDYCGVTSRSQILPNTPAGDKFLKLHDDYILWSETDKFVETE